MSAAVYRGGFTLVEVLTVVVLLGILAVIVIPRFVGATDDSQEVLLTTDLAIARRQIALYIAAHGKGPHLDEVGGVRADEIGERMTGRTDPDGRLNASGACGPYLVRWPANPFCDEAVARDVLVGLARRPPRNGKTGWYYSTATCILSVNSRQGGESTDPEGPLIEPVEPVVIPTPIPRP